MKNENETSAKYIARRPVMPGGLNKSVLIVERRMQTSPRTETGSALHSTDNADAYNVRNKQDNCR